MQVGSFTDTRTIIKDADQVHKKPLYKLYQSKQYEEV